MANPAVKSLNAYDANTIGFSALRKNAKGGKMIYVNTPNQKTYFELPVLRAPFGLSSFTDQNSGNVSYSLDVSLEDQATVAKIRAIEALVLDHVTKNSEELLGRKYSPEIIKEALFKSCIRESKDGKYAPTLKLKVMHTDGVYAVKTYGPNKEPADLGELQKGQRVRTIIDINQVWIIDNKFGLSLRLKQVMLMPTTELKDFAFDDENLDQETKETEDGDYQEDE